MNVLSNLGQARASHLMFDRNGSSGFTLLQGHIQLMAMVPNLPENQTSPRSKAALNLSPESRNTLLQYDYVNQQSAADCQSLPITPRMMPSASNFKRPHLPSILASKASQYNGYHHHPSFLSSNCCQQPRSLSSLSLPPKPAQPITMPSFAKCLPGTKRTFGGGIIPETITYSNGSGGGGDCKPLGSANTSSYFPVISSAGQPSFQPVTQATTLSLNKENQYHQQQLTMGQQCTPELTWLSPQMAYQMLNIVPAHYAGGSGDSSMMSALHHQLRLQQQHQQGFEQTRLVYSSYPHPQQVVADKMPYQAYSQPPPYAVQSMPCFGTPCSSSNNMATYTMQNFSVTPTTAHGIKAGSNTTGANGGGGGLVLPPVSTASMPEICFTTMPAHHHHHHQQSPTSGREPVIPLFIKRSKKGAALGKKEISVVVEDSTSTSSSSSSSSSEDENLMMRQIFKKKMCSKSSKSISVLKLREIQKEKEEKKAQEEARYAALGPESDPGKIPSNPRVTHTPLRLKALQDEAKKETANQAASAAAVIDKNNNKDKGKNADNNDKCSDECYCAHCKCCMKKTTYDDDDNETKQHQQPQRQQQQQYSLNLEEKFKKVKNNLTPRRKGKPVVVALHDCFPSDSSVTEADSDAEDSVRRSCFNYTAGNNGTVVRKRKPRIDNILKTRTKGNSSEVFDDLEDDLNPDEMRTYTCEYLVELLTSEDWNNCYIALQIIIRLARHRPKVLLNYLGGPILWCTFHHITSPKSALCRASIVTFKELFQKIGSALDNDLEKIMEKLVLKSLAPNMFIRQECDRALEAMVGHCNLVKVLNALDVVTKKPHSRAAGHILAKMALQVVQLAGVDLCLKPLYAEKLLPMLFCFMTEANNGTRTAAKEALGMLMNHLQFETAVTRHVTFDKNCTEVFKKLDKMRGRNRNRRNMGNGRYPLPHAHFKR